MKKGKKEKEERDKKKKRVEVREGRVRKRIEEREEDSGQQFFDLAASETAQSEKGNRKSAGEQPTKTNDTLLSLVLSSIQTPLILILLELSSGGKLSRADSNNNDDSSPISLGFFRAAAASLTCRGLDPTFTRKGFIPSTSVRLSTAIDNCSTRLQG